MSFRIKQSESPDRAVRRICRERIGKARARLRRDTKPAAIHGARKDIKKLRAIFRLVRDEIADSDYQKGARTLRAAAGCLAASRDARVMARAFEKVAGPSAGQFAVVERALQKHVRRETRRFQRRDSLDRAERLLRKAKRRVDKLHFATSGWAALEPGVRSSYRRGRQAFEKSSRETSPDNLHRWRKHVKDLWTYLRLLCPAWPAPVRDMTGDLNLLGNLLGDDHDLVLLQDFIGKLRGGAAGEVAALNRLVELRQKKLRAAALKLGKRLYSENPSQFCRRLGACWNAWRGRHH